MTDETLVFVHASDDELNEIVAGRSTGYARPWRDWSFAKADATVAAVLSRSSNRPLALVVPDAAQRRLFGRFATLRSDFSPLSAWCHIFDGDLADSIDGTTRAPSLDGLEASWVGLSVAEASLLAGRSPDKLKVSACLATCTFAVARTAAMWPRVSISEVIGRHEKSNQLVRGVSTGASPVTRRLAPIWDALLEAAPNNGFPQRATAVALRRIANYRENDRASEHVGVASAFVGPDSALIRDLATDITRGPSRAL